MKNVHTIYFLLLYFTIQFDFTNKFLIFVTVISDDI